MSQVKVFSTSGSHILAEGVCACLRTRLPSEMLGEGVFSPSRSIVERFSNENILVQVDNVRGCLAVIIHTQASPVNENLIELFQLIDAISNAKAAGIILVFPYMPYVRSDYKKKGRVATMAKLLAKIISKTLEIKQVILVDPHAPQIKHYFDPAADEITGMYLIADYIEREFFNVFPREECVAVFADAGAAKRYEEIIIDTLKLPVAHIHKSRFDHSERPLARSLSGDIHNKVCLLFDDEILTGKTVIEDAYLLRSQNARVIAMFAMHGVFADKVLPYEEVMQRLVDAPLERIVVGNNIPVIHKVKGHEKFIVLNFEPLLAEAISREILNKSLTELHEYRNVYLYRSQ